MEGRKPLQRSKAINNFGDETVPATEVAIIVLIRYPMRSISRRVRAVVCKRTWRRVTSFGALVVLLTVSAASGARAQQAPDQSPAPSQVQAPAPQSVTCASKVGERNSCPADTSAGIVLLRSTGDGPCLLGKTWGYDQASVWVSDGCSGEFATGRQEAPAPPTKLPAPRHVPNAGFLL